MRRKVSETHDHDDSDHTNMTNEARQSRRYNAFSRYADIEITTDDNDNYVDDIYENVEFGDGSDSDASSDDYENFEDVHSWIFQVCCSVGSISSLVLYSILSDYEYYIFFT